MVTTAEAITTSGNIACATITPTAYGKTITRAEQAEETLRKYDLRLHLCVTDEAQPVLVNAASASKLGIVRGTVGTDTPSLQTTDLKAAGATTVVILTSFDMPPEYIAANTLQLVLVGGMITTVSDTTAKTDVEVWTDDGDGTVSADICQTASQDINSLTAGEDVYTLNAAAISPGDKLHIRLSIVINDAATGTAVIGAIYRAYIRTTIKG